MAAIFVVAAFFYAHAGSEKNFFAVFVALLAPKSNLYMRPPFFRCLVALVVLGAWGSGFFLGCVGLGSLVISGGNVLAALNSFFMKTAVVMAEVPNPGQGEAPPGADGFLTVLKWAAWFVFVLAVLGILITGGKMMINNHRGQGGEHLAALGWVCGGCAIAAAASGIVGVFVK